MEIHFHVHETLPRLAWCAHIRTTKSGAVVRVNHGPWVEVWQDAFAEGVWDEEFRGRGFDQSAVFMGSGGRLFGDRVCFVTPCHNLDSLFQARDKDDAYVSNSLSFLLEASGWELDLSYSYYRTDIWSRMVGGDRYVKQLPTVNGAPIQMFDYVNIEMGEGLNHREVCKPQAAPWNGFDDYRNFLARSFQALHENGASPERKWKYELLATVSSGYDSPAAAVLATEAGCREAISFQQGIEWKTTGATVDDSGVEIARLLGMEVTSCDDDGIPPPSDEVAAEFAACGDGFDLKFRAFERSLPGRILVTGHPGESWKAEARETSPMSRATPVGSSLSEFRLRVGFVHLPVVALGWSRCPQLIRIARSAEMAAWSVGGDYDKPIPRRILERTARDVCPEQERVVPGRAVWAQLARRLVEFSRVLSPASSIWGCGPPETLVDALLAEALRLAQRSWTILDADTEPFSNSEPRSVHPAGAVGKSRGATAV